MAKRKESDRIVHIAVDGVKLEGSLIIPSKASGVALFGPRHMYEIELRFGLQSDFKA